MPNAPQTIVDDSVAAINAANRRARLLVRVQIALVVLCFAALIASISLKLAGGRAAVVMALGLIGGLCGLGAVIPGRAAQRSYSQAEGVRKNSERLVVALKKREGGQPTKIPLTIGFANLSGDDLNAIASEDAAALSPLFATFRLVSDHSIPSAEIIFLYAHLNADGTIKGPTRSGIRQVVQLTNAAIVVLASPNSSANIQNAAALPGPKTANIVFTLDRNGAGFGRFFRELFEKMRDGKDMLTAWVELAPQNPRANVSYAPQTILVAEGGKIAFPRG